MGKWITTCLMAAAVFGVTTRAQAEFVPLLTFEGPDIPPDPDADGGEGLGANVGGVLGTFGATEGTTALSFPNKDLASGNQVMFDIGTVNGNPADPNGGGNPERLANYNAINAAVQAATAGQDVFLEMDITYDATDVTTRGFIQLGVFTNSDAGFDGVWFGGLLNGDVGPPPSAPSDFPQLGGDAAAGGATLTVLDPSNFSAGDFVGAVRISLPVGPTKVLLLGNGTDGLTLDFAQLGFNIQEGYAGGLDLGYDRIGFQIGPVPEPASLATLALAGMSLLARHRPRRG